MATPRPVVALFLAEVKVTDWPAMVRWYVEALDLALAPEDADRRYALLDAGPGRVALKGGAPPGLPRGAVRLVFEVADLDDERERLSRLDPDLDLGPIEESREGYRAIRLNDPEGTPITLFSWKT